MVLGPATPLSEIIAAPTGQEQWVLSTSRLGYKHISVAPLLRWLVRLLTILDYFWRARLLDSASDKILRLSDTALLLVHLPLVGLVERVHRLRDFDCGVGGRLRRVEIEHFF